MEISEVFSIVGIQDMLIGIVVPDWILLMVWVSTIASSSRRFIITFASSFKPKLEIEPFMIASLFILKYLGSSSMLETTIS